VSLDPRSEQSLPGTAGTPRWAPASMHKRAVAVAFPVLAVAVAIGAGWLASQPQRLQISVQFVGYTNVSWGQHCALVQVSNASPITIIRARSPQVALDSPTVVVGPAPTGLCLLEPGDSELVLTEPLPNGIRWRMTVKCQRLERDDVYGLVEDRGLRALQTRVASWLEDHRAPIRLPRPEPRPYAEFATDWIEP